MKYFVIIFLIIGKEPPPNATQEEYDRWLAFQIASAESEAHPVETTSNTKKQKPLFRRSQSMPEHSVSYLFYSVYDEDFKSD